jgi:zinc protease
MIHYEYFTLPNGLQVYHHFDETSPMAVFNLCYNVGSRDESPELTGFAHLFEHLMFSGSVNIPDYDRHVQNASGENNAFTSPDITNYYITIPAKNIETAFWLESDRMLGLSFDPHGLEVQRKVVVEEFKQRYLNQPYGDALLRLRPLAYKNHPYQWATIGKDIAHIENAEMDQVKDFFFRFYRPNNAILVVAGNVSFEVVRELSYKYFADIEPLTIERNAYITEPKQVEPRLQTVEAAVPSHSLYKAYHNAANYTDTYFVDYVINGILGGGASSRLHQSLVEKNQIFTQVQCMLTQSLSKP